MERSERGQSAKRRGDGESRRVVVRGVHLLELGARCELGGKRPETVARDIELRQAGEGAESGRELGEGVPRQGERLELGEVCPGGVGGEARDAVAVEDERAELDAFAQLARDLDEVVELGVRR